MRKVTVWKTAAVLVAIGYVAAVAYYHLVYAGGTEAVTIVSGNIQLAGILVRPKGPGPHPAVVMLHDSGAEIASMPVNRINTNAFVRRGFAVLSYDKRGAGNSGGNLARATFADFADDAVNAVESLRSFPDIRADRIGLFGSGAGGWLTPQVAARAGNIAFIVNRCASPMSWEETHLYELRNELTEKGWSSASLNIVLDLRRRVWRYYRSVVDDPSLATGVLRDELNAELAGLTGPDVPLPSELPPYRKADYERTLTEIAYDPRPWLVEIDVPMLYVFGELDVNVPAEKSARFLESFRRAYEKDITVIVFPGVGHSLRHWTGVSRGGYVKGYLGLIGRWAQDQVN